MSFAIPSSILTSVTDTLSDKGSERAFMSVVAPDKDQSAKQPEILTLTYHTTAHGPNC